MNLARGNAPACVSRPMTLLATTCQSWDAHALLLRHTARHGMLPFADAGKAVRIGHSGAAVSGHKPPFMSTKHGARPIGVIPR
jgi:hypothetical protein